MLLSKKLKIRQGDKWNEIATLVRINVMNIQEQSFSLLYQSFDTRGRLISRLCPENRVGWLKLITIIYPEK